MTISKEQIVAWLEKTATVLNEQKEYLTQLDSAIGDADHGANMARGFKKVMEKLPTFADKDIGNILKNTGMALISSVGGASGPLYGTFYMRAATPTNGKEELDGDDVAAMLKAGMEGVISRGRAEVGDKTMIDAWTPAVEALQQSLADGADVKTAVTACVSAAEQGMKDTIPLQAKKGRASYLGERSKGHQDPGATSTYFILKALSDVL